MVNRGKNPTSDKGAEETNFLSKMVSLGQDRLTEVAGELLNNEQFVDALQKAFEKTVEVKGKIDKKVQFLLNAMNLPSKADYDHLNSKITGLKKGVKDLSEKIDEISDHLEQSSKAVTAETSKAKDSKKKPSAPPKKATSKKSPAKSEADE